MRKACRYLVSWALYFVGDAVSRPMQHFDLAFLYPAYSRLITWSCCFQEEGGPGPWEFTRDEYGENTHSKEV